MPEKQKNLHRQLADRIHREGPVTVAEYMGLAAEFYYGAQNPFGAKGDFITAPEISQMFGEMIGAWLVDAWMQLGRPEKVNLVELGPGRGTLMADIMRILSAWPDFKSAIDIHLVEMSPQLKDMQAATLKDYAVSWHDHVNVNDVPGGISFIVANEFFDALPIHQFIKSGGVWKERGVGYDAAKDSFHFVTLAADDAVAPLAGEGKEGDIFEVSPATLGIVENISRRIAEQGGAALIIDYGHTEAALGDTLQAVSRHQYANPLEKPGEYDITAHVDFGTIKRVAEQYVNVAGPVTQGQFLIALGIEARAHRLIESANNHRRRGIMDDMCRLIAPRDMGRLFKVIALTSKEAIIEPAGFGMVTDNNEVSDNEP